VPRYARELTKVNAKANVKLTSSALAGVLALLSIPALAQPTAPAGEPPLDAARVRYQIRILEGVLENAVEEGARVLGRDLREVSPGLLFFSGPARARGFRLEGYGVFFDVDVPALHRSMIWSMRTLRQSNIDVARALQSLKRYVAAVQADARTKQEIEQALRLVELQVGPPAPMRASPDTRPVSESPARVAPQSIEPAIPGPAPDADPAEVYTAEVKKALIEAMIDHGSALSLGADEWFTVAARDNGDRIGAGDLADTVTITLRLKGADLAAFRTGRLTRDEIRQRVDVREF
jgi:hypothetical protein